MKANAGKGFGQGKALRSSLPTPKRMPQVRGRTGLRIIALTPVGSAALARHRQERSLAPMQERLVFRAFYDEIVESEDPYVIRILHRKQQVALLVPFESLVGVIDRALLENGATRGIDYEVERL